MSANFIIQLMTPGAIFVLMLCVGFEPRPAYIGLVFANQGRCCWEA
jgi:hypothetical protein